MVFDAAVRTGTPDTAGRSQGKLGHATGRRITDLSFISSSSDNHSPRLNTAAEDFLGCTFESQMDGDMLETQESSSGVHVAVYYAFHDPCTRKARLAAKGHLSTCSIDERDQDEIYVNTVGLSDLQCCALGPP